jgi:hypothetical protein
LNEEAVKEEEARKYAKDEGAIFRLTSAENFNGINELFDDLGLGYLEPSFLETIKKNEEMRKGSLKLEKNENNINIKKKHKCCF